MDRIKNKEGTANIKKSGWIETLLVVLKYADNHQEMSKASL
jgi:hypothetical protein